MKDKQIIIHYQFNHNEVPGIEHNVYYNFSEDKLTELMLTIFRSGYNSMIESNSSTGNVFIHIDKKRFRQR